MAKSRGEEGDGGRGVAAAAGMDSPRRVPLAAQEEEAMERDSEDSRRDSDTRSSVGGGGDDERRMTDKFGFLVAEGDGAGQEAL